MDHDERACRSRSPSTIEVGFKDRDFIDARKCMSIPIWTLPSLPWTTRRSLLRPSCRNSIAAICRGWPRRRSVRAPVGLELHGHPGDHFRITSRFLEEICRPTPHQPGEFGRAADQPAARKDRRINTATLAEKNAQNVNFVLPMKYACKVLALLREGRNPSPPELRSSFSRTLTNEGNCGCEYFLDPENFR